MENKLLAKILVIDCFVIILVLVAVPQESILATIGISILVFLFITLIFMFGLQTVRSCALDTLQGFPSYGFAIIATLLPMFIIIVTGGTLFSTDVLLIFFIWYLTPALLFILPDILRKSKIELHPIIQTTIIIVGAIILWIGFDHRYTKILFLGWKDMGYLMNSLWVAAVGFATFGYLYGIQNMNNENDFGLTPNLNNAKTANNITLIASSIVIPFGLLTGFLKWNPAKFDFFNIFVGFVGIYLTISIQEELIFRGIILNRLDKLSNFTEGWKHISVLILVSIAFAITHWNNETPEFVYHYFFAAFIAGLGYGIAYRKGGMFAAVLSHTLVDWVWALLLKRL